MGPELTKSCARAFSLLLLAAAAPLVLGGELAALVARAEQEDPSYQAVLAAAEAARSEYNVVRADLLPAVSFHARAAGNTQDIDVASGAVGLDGRQSFDSEFYEAEARQPVLHWDRWLRLKQSDERVARAEAEVALYYAEMVMQIVRRYFDVLGARDDLVTGTAEKRALEAQLEQVRTRYELGGATEAELIEAQADVDRAAAELVRAESAIEIGLAALRELVGSEVSIGMRLGDDLVPAPPSPADLGHWTALAAERNPRVLSSRSLIELADFDRRIARAGHLPSIDLVGRYGHDSQGGRFGNTDINSRSIGLEVEVPIFQGGATWYRQKAAGHRMAEAESRAEAEQRAVMRETAEAYRRIEMSVAETQATRRALASSQAALEAIRTQYEGGFRTIADVIEAHKNVFTARRNLSRALRNFVVDRLMLKYASGTLALDDLAMTEALLVADQASVEHASERVLGELVAPPQDAPSAAPDAAPAQAVPAAPIAAGDGADPAPAPAAPPDPAAPQWQINVASFRDRASAEPLLRRMAVAGLEPSVQTAEIDGQTWYRVRVAGYTERAEADVAAGELGVLLDQSSLWVTNR